MSSYKHVLMGDTDSAYVRFDYYAERHGLVPDKKIVVDLADRLQAQMKRELAGILADKFVTKSEHISILTPGREIVARKGLFKDKKKRYALHIVDKEGFDTDKLKIMGMETRRSDTPAVIQTFLTECLVRVVQKDQGYDDLRGFVDEFREKFRGMDGWRRGSPGRVKNLATATKAFDAWADAVATGMPPPELPRMHITVKAALSSNRLMDHHGETRWDRIRDGDKVEVIYLKPNPELLDCVAIRTGEIYVPDWFKQLPFDVARMEEKLVDQKLFNVIGDILGWDFRPDKTFAKEVVKMSDFYD